MLFGEFISAQISKTVKWTSSINIVSAHESIVSFTASIEESWTLYSTKLPEDGPIPTSVKWEKLEGATLKGDLTPSRPAHEEVDMVFHLKLGWWANNVTLSQTLTIQPDTNVFIEG